MAYKNPELDRDKEEVKKIPIIRYFDKVILPAKGDYYQHFDLENEHTCNCPLHDENTASFRWFPDTNTFFCYGCGAGGDNIKLHTDFIHKQSGVWVSFEKAIEDLKKIGNGQEITDNSKISRLNEIKSTTAELLLWSKELSRVESLLATKDISERMEIYCFIDTACMLIDKKLKNASVAKEELKNLVKERLEKKEL